MGQGQRFCAICGFDTQGQVPAGQSLSQSQRPKSAKNNTWLFLVIIIIVVAIVGIGILSATYVMNTGNQNNPGTSLPPISGVTVNASKPRYVAAMEYMIMTIYVTNERSTYLEIYNDTYVATLNDSSKLTGYYEGPLDIKITPGGTGSFVIKFDSGTWVDLVSLRFADESGYVDVPVPQ